jgi:N6-adenosine-specific RNA methylase IME4
VATYRLQIPSGFGTIVLDPPWPWRDTLNKKHYDSMTLDEIRAIPVRASGADHLWMWTTNAHLVEALITALRWGYQYRSLLTWAKPRSGVGWWLRGQTEHVIFATRTRQHRRRPDRISTLLSAPRRAHSVKPDEFYEIVQTLSPGPYLELFARRPRAGWTTLISDRPPEEITAAA